jgi:hypothetical protein
MVNFRFHIISLIAVFLALGLGVLMGSTVLDDQIVDRLDREIRDVRNESSARKAENDRLKDELGRAEAYMRDAASFTVAGRLTSVPVAVFAERGVDGGIVDDTVALLEDAGAVAPAIYWLEEPWQLRDSEEVNALKAASGATGNAAAVREQALGELVERLTRPVDTTTPPATDILVSLRDAGFVGIDGDEAAVAAFPDRPASAILITGPDSRLAGSDVTVEMARVFADDGVPAVVAEAYVDRDDPDAPDRGESVAAVRSDEELANQVSTLDDLELVQGRVTAVIALEGAADGIVGHYGYGGGATNSVPTPPTTVAS